MQILAKFKKNSVHGVQSHLKFSKIYYILLASTYQVSSEIYGGFFYQGITLTEISLLIRPPLLTLKSWESWVEEKMTSTTH